MNAPEGYTEIQGDSRELATALIKASHAVLDDQGVSIIKFTGGYFAPDKVAEYFAEHEGDDELGVSQGAVGDPFSLEAPETNHTAWVESTTIKSERTLSEGSTPITEAAAAGQTHTENAAGVGVGTDTTLAVGNEAAEAPADSEATGEEPEDETPEEPEDETPEEPAGNASGADWLAYAKTQPTYDDTTDAELGRDALREKFSAK